MTEKIEATAVTPPAHIKISQTADGATLISFRWFRPMQGILVAFMLIVFTGTFVYLLSQWQVFKPLFITAFALGLGVIFVFILWFSLRIILNTTTIELADYAIIVKVRPISRWQTTFIPVDDIQSIRLAASEQSTANAVSQKLIVSLNSGEEIMIGSEFYTAEEAEFIQQTIAQHYNLTR
jgi:hypothetical protein